MTERPRTMFDHASDILILLWLIASALAMAGWAAAALLSVWGDYINAGACLVPSGLSLPVTGL